MGSVTTVAKIAIVLAAMFTALCVHSLGVVNVLNGAMSAAVFVAVIPSVIGLCLLDGNICKKSCLCMLLVGGLTVAGIGLVLTKNYVEDLTCHVCVTSGCVNSA